MAVAGPRSERRMATGAAVAASALLRQPQALRRQPRHAPAEVLGLWRGRAPESFPGGHVDAGHDGDGDGIGKPEGQADEDRLREQPECQQRSADGHQGARDAASQEDDEQT